MGMRDRNLLFSVTAQQQGNIHRGEIVDVDEPRMSYRPARNGLNNTRCATLPEQNNAVDSSRIKALKEDLVYFRCMIEQMVQQKTAKTDYHVSILKSCNSTPGESYHKMHKKYLDLLNRTQAYEAEMHLRVLEGELAMLLKTQALDVKMQASWSA